MAVSAQTLLKEVSVDVLQDPSAIKWPMPQLVRFLNTGQRDIVTFRPDACVTQDTLVLAAGTMQALPSGAKQLLNVLRNTSGNKRAVTMPKNCRALLDAQNPNWRNQTGTTEIFHVMYDERDLQHFEVYPPALNTASLEIVYSRLPTDVTVPADGTIWSDVTGNIDVADIFANALKELILFRCFYKDAQYAAQGARAGAHLSNASNLLGVDLKSLTTFGPQSDDTSGTPATST